MTLSMTTEPIRSLVSSIDLWDPRRHAEQDREFDYIDISSVDRVAKCVNGLSRIRVSEAPSRARQRVQAGDVLVSTVRPNLNAVAIVPSDLQDGTASTGFCVLRPREKRLDSRYLFYWVRTAEFIGSMTRLATGASYPAVTDRTILDSLIPLPPHFDEQRRIADILDEADSLRQKRAKASRLAYDLVPSLFYEMFGDLKLNLRQWPLRAIGEFAEVGTGTTPSRNMPGYFGGEIPWVKTTEVQGEPICDTEEKLTDVGFQAARSKLYPIDSIIVALYGQGKTRGQVARLAVPAATNQACAVITPNDGYVTDYLITVLRLSYEELRAMSRGGNQQNLNLELIRSFRFPFAPLALQRTFAEMLRDLNVLRDQQRESKQELDNLFDSLLQRAFRGGL